ncbi:MAG: cytochrome P450 [Actinomycetota bacterium]|nr:cytochrome P450 [Actinomycetota bacterium]
MTARRRSTVGFDADPHPAYDWLRRNAPVHRIDLPGGAWAWLVTRYSDARRALADPNLAKDPARACEPWRRAGLGLPLDHRPSLARHMLNVDAPDHARLRRLVSHAFTPRRTDLLRRRAEEITDRLLAALAPRGAADLVAELAYPLPITIICDLLGVPEADRADFHRYASVIDSAEASAVDEVAQATDALDEYLAALVSTKRTTPADDMLSDLVAAQAGGVISADELTSTAFLLLVAGHETTVALIGNGLLALMQHPEQASAARVDPSRVPAIVEEVLRWDGPVRNATWRFPLEPSELGGMLLQPGEPVLVSLLAASRDPEAYPHPEVFDPDRDGRPHLAFGVGPHFCIGAALARIEGEVAIGAVLRRFPDLTLGAPAPSSAGGQAPIMLGLFALPVTFTPSATAKSSR